MNGAILITSLVFPHEEAAIAMLPKTWKIAWVHSSMHFSEHFAGNGRSSFEIKKLSGLQRVFANSRVAKLAMSEESQLLPQTSQREPGFFFRSLMRFTVISKPYWLLYIS